MKTRRTARKPSTSTVEHATHAIQMTARHGQLTVFIILGLAILIGVAVTLYIQGKIGESGEKFRPIIDEVPTEFVPLKHFVDSCLQKSAEDGLRKIGMHGGYIGLTAADTRYTDTAFSVDISGQRPTDFEAISFTPNGNWQIPYWYHLSAENDCSGDCAFAVQRPPLYRSEGDGSIEEQLDRYVTERVMECLGEWEAFTIQGIQIAASEAPEVRTVIAESDVRFFLRYPIAATSEFGTRRFQNFGITVDVNLLELYNLATEILNTQMQSKMLEANTMNVIAGMSGLDEGSLPPPAATEFSHAPRYWVEHEVQQRVQDLLAVHLQSFTVQGTRNFQDYRFPGDPVKEGLYRNFILPMAEEHPAVAAEFTYLPIWSSYFDAGPGLITSTGAISSSMFSWLPLKQYNVPYDLSYPVVITLTNPDAMAQQGYTFTFALEVNIRNNQAIDEEFVPLSKATMGGGGQFCNANQRNSGNITITVRDPAGNPIPEAAVFFSAGTSCLLGSTDAAGMFIGTFPVGIGAVTITKSPDYLTVHEPFATKLDTPNSIDVTLEPIIEKQVRAMKMSVQKYGKEWVFNPSPQFLSNDENAIIIVTREAETPYEEDFVEMAQIEGDGEATLRLVPGRFDVEILLIDGDADIRIPKTKICKKFMGVFKKCVKIPEIKLAEGTFMEGRTSLTNWRVSRNKLNEDSTIRFHALNFDIESVPEANRHPNDLKIMGKMENYSEDHRTELEPVFLVR